MFVSCGTAVHLERHEKIRNIFCGTTAAVVAVVVVSHHRIGCQPEKNITFPVATAIVCTTTGVLYPERWYKRSYVLTLDYSS